MLCCVSLPVCIEISSLVWSEPSFHVQKDKIKASFFQLHQKENVNEALMEIFARYRMMILQYPNPDLSIYELHSKYRTTCMSSNTQGDRTKRKNLPSHLYILPS